MLGPCQVLGAGMQEAFGLGGPGCSGKPID